MAESNQRRNYSTTPIPAPILGHRGQVLSTVFISHSDDDHWWPRSLGEALIDRGVLRQDRTELEDRLEALTEEFAAGAARAAEELDYFGWPVPAGQCELNPVTWLEPIPLIMPEVGDGLANAMQRCGEQTWYSTLEPLDDFISQKRWLGRQKWLREFNAPPVPIVRLDEHGFVVIDSAALLSHRSCELLELVQQIHAIQTQIALRDDLIAIRNLQIKWFVRQLRVASSLAVITQQRAFFILHSFHPPHCGLQPATSVFGEFALAS